MVDSKAVAVVTEGLEVLHIERRIFWGVGGLLKDSEHEWERLPAQAPPFPLHNLLQEKINEDLVLDCHLLSP